MLEEDQATPYAAKSLTKKWTKQDSLRWHHSCGITALLTYQPTRGQPCLRDTACHSYVTNLFTWLQMSAQKSNCDCCTKQTERCLDNLLILYLHEWIPSMVMVKNSTDPKSDQYHTNTVMTEKMWLLSTAFWCCSPLTCICFIIKCQVY